MTINDIFINTKTIFYRSLPKDMHIIAHRGFWQTEDEKNTESAFHRALHHGFGIETDFRDCAGNLVIAHNPPQGDEMPAEYFFRLYTEYNTDSYLALNIKADGLQDAIKYFIVKYDIKNYFVFDMSSCDTLWYIKKGLNIFSRKSEFEPYIIFPNECKGIWYDMFDSKYFNEHEIGNYILCNKKVCLVSPELHIQDYKDIWLKYKQFNSHELLLCTDNPAEASLYFNSRT